MRFTSFFRRDTGPFVTTNEILISLRYVLNVNDAKLVEILELANYLATHEEIVSYLKREEEAGFVPCPDEVVAHFLNGLVIFKRGKDETRPAAPVELPVTNN